MAAMTNLEEALRQTDFSKYTDLKQRLAGKLFSKEASRKVLPFSRITDEDAAYVNAAQGIPDAVLEDLLRKPEA